MCPENTGVDGEMVKVDRQVTFRAIKSSFDIVVTTITEKYKIWVFISEQPSLLWSSYRELIINYVLQLRKLRNILAYIYKRVSFKTSSVTVSA